MSHRPNVCLLLKDWEMARHRNQNFLAQIVVFAAVLLVSRVLVALSSKSWLRFTTMCENRWWPRNDECHGNRLWGRQRRRGWKPLPCWLLKPWHLWFFRWNLQMHRWVRGPQLWDKTRVWIRHPRSHDKLCDVVHNESPPPRVVPTLRLIALLSKKRRNKTESLQKTYKLYIKCVDYVTTNNIINDVLNSP